MLILAEFKRKTVNQPKPGISILKLSDPFDAFASRLIEIFSDMDRDYARIAGQYGFHCSGCEESCCKTRFYHHTYLELLLLNRGLERLQPHQRTQYRSRAEDVRRREKATAQTGEIAQPMCPLNQNGMCGLYDCRPMICRLHGIPHALSRPDGGQTVGPGCDAFHRQCGPVVREAVLDRTPHYSALAALEREFRMAAGLRKRIKLTVAEMTSWHIDSPLSAQQQPNK